MTILLSAKETARAAGIIRKGGTVAFPTETVYGLGADALNAKAVKKIFRAKGRPSDNPLIVHIASRKDVYKLADDVPRSAELLMEKFWPGPLTMVLKKSKSVPKIATAGLNTVAIRMPRHKVALALIKAAKAPIAAPSANLSGKPSPTSAEHVIFDLSGKIDAIIDGGETDIGIESTVIDLTSKVPAILRPGKITREQLKKVLGKIATHHGKQKTARSPGMKHRHYAPEAKMIIVKGKPAAVKKEIAKLAKAYGKMGKRVAVIKIGKNLEATAKNLFAILRHLDRKKFGIILSESIPKKGLGVAIMDRLERAAGNNIIEV
jgi:L-threonylcarbamoyladenylate synthase